MEGIVTEDILVDKHVVGMHHQLEHNFEDSEHKKSVEVELWTQMVQDFQAVRMD